MKMKHISYKNNRINNNGFTIIEIVITMAIFGFLIYVISSVLIVIIQTSYTASQRSQLRDALEVTMKQISNDAQFAQSVYSCGTSCIGLIVPSTNTYTNGTSTGTGTEVKDEKIYLDSSLQTVVKSVIINGGAASYYRLSPSNVSIVSLNPVIGATNINLQITGHVVTGSTSKGTQTTSLTLGELIQFDHQ